MPEPQMTNENTALKIQSTPQTAKTPRGSSTKDAFKGSLRGMSYDEGSKALSPQGGQESKGLNLLSDPILAQVAQGKTIVNGGAGSHIKLIQEALIAKGFPLPKYGADGRWGTETSNAVKAFQASQSLKPDGIVGRNTLLALCGKTPTVSNQPEATSAQPEATTAPVSTTQPEGPLDNLTNPFFEGNPILTQVIKGQKTISSGAGRHIQLVQQALINLGYNLPVYGADSSWGGETVTALKQFEKDHVGKVDGVLDAQAMSALNSKAPPDGKPLTKFPKYEELFKDGLLDATIAVGYDENFTFDSEIERIRMKIKSELGCEKVDASQAAQAYKGAGMSMPSKGGGEYFLAKDKFKYKNKGVSVLIRLITYKDPEIKEAYLEALQKSDVSIYTGHGRYGSGPDFDDKHSNKGNVWINPEQRIHEGGATQVYNELKASNTERPLEKIQFDQKYRVWFFDGCNTRLYMNALRANATIDHRNIDVFGAGTEISVSTTADDVIAFVAGLINQQSAQAIVERLNKINGITDNRKGFQAEGLGDNPVTP